MKELRAVKPYETYYERLEKEIILKMRELFFQIIPNLKLNNVNNPLEYAIAAGRIWYEKKGFYGEFNSRTSKMLKDIGAKWNKKNKSWEIPLESVPANILSALSQASASNSAKIDEILKKLDLIKSPEFIKSEAIEKNVISMGKNIEETIPTQKVDLNTEYISRKYTDNMDLNIKAWSEREIISLRELIKDKTAQGLRYEKIVEEISKRFNTSVNHAKFLARQETHLLLSELKVEKYRGAGIHRYRWKTMNYPVGHEKKNVRPDHAVLNNKIFDWEHPPIIDHTTGQRGHPGQGFNCRCVAIPIWDGE